MSWKQNWFLTGTLYAYMAVRAANFLLPDKGTTGHYLFPEGTWASWRLSHYDASGPKPQLPENVRKYLPVVRDVVEYAMDQAVNTHLPDSRKGQLLETIIEERQHDPSRYMQVPTEEEQRYANAVLDQNLLDGWRPGDDNWYSLSPMKAAMLTTRDFPIWLLRSAGPDYRAVKYVGQAREYTRIKRSHDMQFQEGERSRLESEIDSMPAICTSIGTPTNIVPYGVGAGLLVYWHMRRRTRKLITTKRKKKAA